LTQLFLEIKKRYGEFFMAQTKRELVEAALENKKVERVPVGFWFHFVENEDKADAFTDPTLSEKILRGIELFMRHLNQTL